METILFRTKYGSHLYGCNTPSSDYDEKVIYLPHLESILLGKKLDVYKERFDSAGNKLAENVKMPSGGKETEYIPFQKFAKDFFDGETYAIELAFALTHQRNEHSELVNDLVNSFLPTDFQKMLGFANKQVFDLIHKGRRLQKLKEIVQLVDSIILAAPSPKSHDYPVIPTQVRLDSIFEGKKLLEIISERLGVEIGSTTTGNRTLATLKIHGRDYLETLDVRQFTANLLKLIYNYGHRSEDACTAGIDLKSLVHAVRIYQQVIELRETQSITFPRKNAAELIDMRNGKISVEKIQYQLLTLEHEVSENQPSPQPRKKELVDDFETWLLFTLWKLYGLR